MKKTLEKTKKHEKHIRNNVETHQKHFWKTLEKTSETHYKT